MSLRAVAAAPQATTHDLVEREGRIDQVDLGPVSPRPRIDRSRAVAYLCGDVTGEAAGADRHLVRELRLASEVGGVGHDPVQRRVEVAVVREVLGRARVERLSLR